MEDFKPKNTHTLLDKTIDFIFSSDKRKYVVLFFIIALVLRLIAVFTINYFPDELGYVVHSINFINSGKLQIHDQDALWFFLTDLFIKIFGAGILGTRFLSVLLGALSVILIYLIGKEIFDEKTALIASIILTISSYHILTSVGLMDVPMAFFAFLAMYFFILFLKTNKNKFFLLTWINLGLAIMIKQIAALFIPAFILFHIYYNRKYHGKFKIREIFYATLIIVLMVAPVLTYNYLLYKDKDLLDMQFSRFLGRIEGTPYESIANTLNPFRLHTLLISSSGGMSGFLTGFSNVYISESIFILIFAIIGTFLFLFSKNKFKWLLFLSFLFPFIFLAGTSLMANHFVFVSLFTALFSAKGVIWFSNKFKKIQTKKIVIFFIIFLMIIGSGIQFHKYTHEFIGKNEVGKLIDFKNKKIDENSLVVVDSRIYRGKIALMFWDKHYLETNFFPYLMSNLDNLPGGFTSMKTYFIEAVTDDSGWGTVKNQPEFNQTNEQIVSFFEQQSKLIGTINDLENQPHFNIYEGYFNLKPFVLEFADTTHEFFFYPVAYKQKDKIFDDYEVYNLFDYLLDKLAHLILYLEVLLTILVIYHLFFHLYKNS